MEDLAKIKDRIAKLLRMAADASSPEEAGIAAGRARALMDKHQLDEFDVSVIKEEFLEKKATMSLKNFPIYMSTLAVAVAEYNDCQAVYRSDTHDVRPNDYDAKHVLFRGYVTDVNMAVDMFKALLSTIDRLAKEHQTVVLGLTKYEPKLGAAFKTGASSAIIQTLKSLTAKRDALTSSGGHSLVVVKKKAVGEKYGEARYSTVHQKDYNAAEESARTRGWIEGNKVEIRGSIE